MHPSDSVPSTAAPRAQSSLLTKRSSRLEAQSPAVSVILPTYNRAAFIGRAIESLVSQTHRDWELIVIDDGSTDETVRVVSRYLWDPRIRFERVDRNCGMGHALNVGLNNARADYVSYLPSDDVYYPPHLCALLEALAQQPDAVGAFSGLRYHYNRYSDERAPDEPLQLVQVMHRRTSDRWIERDELTTDDLDRMFWDRLRVRGRFVATRHITCEWVAHPDQRHKIIREPIGGPNPYRVRYGVEEPLRFHSTVGNLVDEVDHYRRFRERPDTPVAADGLKILLVGELAYNPERVLALEERGHQLFGLWTADPYWYNSVGPLPFGHVKDLSRNGWRDEIKEIQPDVIYALLNWQCVPFAHKVLKDNPGIPFVWHFKEGPFICLEKGMWNELLDLYVESNGQIYCSPEMRTWFATLDPRLSEERLSLILDGDLPKREWAAGNFAQRRSSLDSGIHTVVPGRPIGLPPEFVGELAQQQIHLHFYGDFTQGQWHAWITRASKLAPQHLHLHPNVDQEDWVKEFSQYDAGWLHVFNSRNQGDIRRSDWDDLNYPARMATLALAGLPMLLSDNAGSLVATQTLARDLDIGVFFSSVDELSEKLHDEMALSAIRNNVLCHIEKFTFDHHADDLIAFFRQVIKSAG